MDNVTLFECAYLEFPPGYQPGDEYVRHTSSCTLSAPVGALIAYMTSEDAAAYELAAQEQFRVPLDLSIAPADAGEYTALYVVASPEFMAGFTGTVEERVMELGAVFRDFIDPTYPCAPLVYASSIVTR